MRTVANLSEIEMMKKLISLTMAMFFTATFAVTGQADVLQSLASAPNEAAWISIHQELNVPRGGHDESGDVNFASFLNLVANYGRSGGGYVGGDLNLDGTTNLGDFAILSTNFGSGKYLPEPSSQPAQANLGLWLGEANELVVSSTSPVGVGGIEINSTGATLDLRDSVTAGATFTFSLNKAIGR